MCSWENTEEKMIIIYSTLCGLHRPFPLFRDYKMFHIYNFFLLCESLYLGPPGGP